MTPEDALRAAGLELPSPPGNVANYRMAVGVGTLLFVSGHGPVVEGGPAHTGRLGDDLDVEGGRRAAESVTLNLLASLKQELGSSRGSPASSS